MRLVCIALLIGIAGCSDSGYGKKKTTSEDRPVFRGTAATKAHGSLTGTWTVYRFGTPEKPGKLGRWEAKWTLEDKGHCWVEANGQGAFHLCSDTPPQMILWKKPDGKKLWFSVNEARFGSLIMTGDDDEQYHAIRTEGCEGR